MHLSGTKQWQKSCCNYMSTVVNKVLSCMGVVLQLKRRLSLALALFNRVQQRMLSPTSCHPSFSVPQGLVPLTPNSFCHDYHANVFQQVCCDCPCVLFRLYFVQGSWQVTRAENWHSFSDDGRKNSQGNMQSPLFVLPYCVI